MPHLLLLLSLCGPFDPADVVPTDTRTKYRNPDGSCVQCSIGIAGVHHCNENAELLLWDSEYGPAERGGSWSGRVEKYARRRGLQIWNVTGGETINWIEWALSTGRYVALGFNSAHFQTAVGMSDDRQTFFVVDNNSTHRVDQYSRAEFLRRHAASGHWCVILKGDAPPPWVGPGFQKWWDEPDRQPQKPKDRNLGFDKGLF